MDKLPYDPNLPYLLTYYDGHWIWYIEFVRIKILIDYYFFLFSLILLIYLLIISQLESKRYLSLFLWMCSDPLRGGGGSDVARSLAPTHPNIPTPN